jgi:hypothetical protein
MALGWAIAAAFVLAAPAQAAPSGYFTANGIGQLSVHRSAHFATPLPDGSVLIGGGVAQQTAEIFHPAAGTFSSVGIGELTVVRAYAGAAPLPDGRVLVVGGTDTDTVHSSTEIFDPAAGEFEPGPELSVPRMGAAVAPLPDGRVLIAGGHTVDSGDNVTVYDSAEIYDPESGEIYTAGVGELNTPRSAAAVAPLPDGRVLIAGGSPDWEDALSSVEVFDPETGEFTSAGEMSTPRWAPAAAPLPDGRVLVAGGSGSGIEPLDTAEIFDPKTGQVSGAGVGAMTMGRLAPAAASLPDGRILIAGGTSFESPSAGESAEAFVSPPAPTGRGLDFGSVWVGKSAGARTLRIANRGAQALLPGRASIAGPARGDYRIVADECRGERLQFREACEIEIRFRPSKRGARNARLVFPSNATDAPVSFPLRGEGQAPKRKARCAKKGKKRKAKRRSCRRR